MMKEQDNIPKTNPFKVPEGYFDEVNRKIIASASGEKREKSAIRPAFRLRPYLLAAASVAVLVMLSYTAIRIVRTDIRKNIGSEMRSDDSLSPWLNDLDTWYLEEKAASVVHPERTSDLKKSEIIDYLILNNIEIDDIYEQL
jgi:hypothetical protein